MERIRNLNKQSIKFLNRDAVIPDLVSFTVLPFSKSLREKVDPSFQPTLKDKAASLVALGVALSPIYLSPFTTNLTEEISISVGILAGFAIISLAAATAISLRRRLL